MPPPPGRPSRVRRRKTWLPVLVVAACLLVGGSIAAISSPQLQDAGKQSEQASAPASSPKQSTPAAPSLPEERPSTKPRIIPPVASAPVQLTVESAGIDLEILPLTPTADDLKSQSIVPPFTLDAYWLTSFGKPGLRSKDTTYITGHSWEDREAPFNRLSTDTKVGDTITLDTETGTLDYVIDSVTTHDKDTLKNSDIWDIVPNRLVLVSCYTEDPWGKNVVVTASPAR